MSWHGNSVGHSLAARGIKVKSKGAAKIGRTVVLHLKNEGSLLDGSGIQTNSLLSRGVEAPEGAEKIKRPGNPNVGLETWQDYVKLADTKLNEVEERFPKDPERDNYIKHIKGMKKMWESRKGDFTLEEYKKLVEHEKQLSKSLSKLIKKYPSSISLENRKFPTVQKGANAYGFTLDKKGKYSAVMLGSKKAGLVGVVPSKVDSKSGNALIVILPEFRGRGLIGPVYKKLVEKHNLNELQASIDKSNKASLKAHKKLGFKPVDKEREKFLRKNNFIGPDEVRWRKSY